MDITTSSLLKDKALTLNEKAFFQYLLDLSNNGEREVRLTYKQIKEELGLTQHSISALYKSLTEKKLIDVKSDRSGTHIKIYTLVHESECEKEDKKTPDLNDSVYQNQNTTYSNEHTTYSTDTQRSKMNTHRIQNDTPKKIFDPLYIYILININNINNKIDNITNNINNINNKLDLLINNKKEKENKKEKQKVATPKNAPITFTYDEVHTAFEDYVSSHCEQYQGLKNLQLDLEVESFYNYWSEHEWKDSKNKPVKSLKGRVATWLTNWLKSYNPKQIQSLQLSKQRVETEKERDERLLREIHNGQIFSYQTDEWLEKQKEKEGRIIDVEQTEEKSPKNSIDFSKFEQWDL